MAKLSRLVPTLLLLIVFLSSMPSETPSSNAATVGSEIDYAALMSNLNMTRVQEDLQKITGYGEPVWSRVTGYPGFYATADYIANEFRKLGLLPIKEYYEITVPIDHGAYVTVYSPEDVLLFNITAYPLWPNSVNPCPYKSPPEGDSLVYAGYGNMVELNNLTIEGSWVLMEFNSRWYWKNPVMLGAKGIIFKEPSSSTRIEAEQKVLGIPYNVPRLYVREDDAQILDELIERYGIIKIHVASNMQWEKKRVPNVTAVINGTSQAKDEVVIAAYYDSFSIVPSLSPGATDAFGVAALLEAARFFKANPPRRSVRLVAFSGHWQGLWGAREFVNAHFLELGMKFKAFIGIDLSSESDHLGVFHTGSLYSYKYPTALQQKYRDVINKFFVNYLPNIQRGLGKEYPLFDMVWKTYPSYILSSPPRVDNLKLVFDHEPFVSACYGGGLTFATVDIMKAFQKTPVDTLGSTLKSSWQVSNLRSQMEVVFSILYSLINDSDLGVNVYPLRFGLDQGWRTLEVQVSQYNLKTAWYETWNQTDPRKVLVRVTATAATTPTGEPIIAAGAAGGGLGTSGLIDLVLIPNMEGKVSIVGLKPYSGGMVTAYVINEETGAVEYAYDSGVYAAPSVPAGMTSPHAFTMMDVYMFKYVSLFRAGSIALIGILNPQTLNPIGGVTFLNFFGHGTPVWGSVDLSPPEAMIYGEPGIPLEVLVSGGEKFPISVLLNVTKEVPTGSGYMIKGGQTLRLSAIELAEGLFELTDSRVSILESHFAFNPRILLYHPEARRYYNNLTDVLEMKEYDNVYASAYSLWSYSRQSYIASMDLMWEIIATAAAFFLVMIPFAFLAERLIFQKMGLKRVALFIGTFIACSIFLLLFHPGYSIATNIYMVLISLAVAVMVAPMIVIIVQEFLTTASVVRRTVLGLHFTEVSRTGILMSSLSLGIQNMRKRKFRSALTLLSVTIVTFTLMTFTSTTSSVILYMVENPVEQIPYNGFLVRKIPWAQIPEELFVFIKTKYEAQAVVVPRAWIIPPSGAAFAQVSLGPKGITLAKGILGLSPQEAEITGIDKKISEGRWFEAEEYSSCIISYSMAAKLEQELGIKIEAGRSAINLWGSSLTVVGLYNAGDMGNLKDIDGESLAPVLYFVGMEPYKPVHVTWDEVVIIPYLAALRVFPDSPTQAPIWSVAVKFKDVNSIEKATLDFSLGSLLDIYFTKGDKVLITRPRTWFSFTGMEMMQVLMVIAGLTLINMTLSAVFERIREISVFSSIGLSPMHIASMFFSENLIYAVVGSILGYIFGILATVVLWWTGLYPAGLFPNFSSIFVGIVMGFASIMTMISTVYPAIKASKLVTPSLERKWKLPTEPHGNNWSIPLPFVAASEREVTGTLEFMREWMEIHSSREVGIFVAEDVTYALDSLTAQIRLAPLDAGVVQKISVNATPRTGGYSFQLEILRISGIDTIWKTANYTFVDTLRKQMLIWRSLSLEEKNQYTERGLQLLKTEKVE